MDRLEVPILVILVLVLLVVAWTAATIYALHRDAGPLLRSPLARTLSGAGT